MRLGKNHEYVAFLLFLTFAAAALLFIRSPRIYFSAMGVPWSDAAGWLAGGYEAFRADFPMTEWACRRPAFPLFIGATLAFFSERLDASLVFLAGLSALAVIILGLMLRLTIGAVRASVAVGLLIVFIYRMYLGTFLTENLGTVLALFGFSVWIIWFIRPRNPWYLFLSGLLIFFALYARAGAFLLLPAVLLVVPIIRVRRGKLRQLAFGIAAIVGGTSLAIFIHKRACPDQVGANANAWYSLYGLSKGGDSWHRFYKDFPAAKSLPDSQAALMAKEAFKDSLLNAPHHFIWGYIRSAGYFLFKDSHILSGILGGLERIFLIFAIGLLVMRSVRRPKRSVWVISAIALSLILSAPFLRDGGFRSFASVLPFYLLILFFPFCKMRSIPRRDLAALQRLGRIGGLGGICCLAITLIPLFVLDRSPQPVASILDKGACPDQYEYQEVRVPGAGSVNISRGATAEAVDVASWRWAWVKSGKEDPIGATAEPPAAFGLGIVNGGRGFIHFILDGEIGNYRIAQTMQLCTKREPGPERIIFRATWANSN